MTKTYTLTEQQMDVVRDHAKAIRHLTSLMSDRGLSMKLRNMARHLTDKVLCVTPDEEKPAPVRKKASSRPKYFAPAD